MGLVLRGVRRDQFFVGEAAADRVSRNRKKAHAVCSRAGVIADNLLIHVAVKMERGHGNVGVAQSPLEQTPEVLQSVGVGLAPDVALGVVNRFVGLGRDISQG